MQSKNLKSFLFVFLAACLLASSLLAQGPPPIGPPSAPRKNDKFISLEGGFTIDLPSQISGFEGISAVPNVSNGGVKYMWRGSFGFFVIMAVSPLMLPEDARSRLRASVDETASQLLANGATMISKTDLLADGNPALDLKYKRQGNSFLSRSVIAGGRIYVLSTYWPETEDGSSRIKILDSFKVVDAKAINAKRLEDATPAPLPQTPKTKQIRSDAENEFLKGKVRSIVEKEEYLDGTGSVGGVITTGEKYFDENGNLTKQVSYDYRGNPDGVTVFGFVDGMRVSKRGQYMDYEYNPPPALMVPSAANAKAKPDVRKPADSRYSESVEYKYDDDHKLIETQRFNNRGELMRKEALSYNGNKVTEVVTDKDGKTNFNILRIYDDKMNLKEQTYFSTSSAYPDDEKYSYQYLNFDQIGNWTKREQRVKTAQYGGGTKDLHSYEYREITYY